MILKVEIQTKTDTTNQDKIIEFILLNAENLKGRLNEMKENNMKNIVIKEVSLEEALKVFPKIEEWDRPEAGTIEYCNKRIENLKHIILAAYVDNENVGYLIGYDKNNSFYCWVVAVDKNYRRMGILTQMMNIFENRAKQLGYNKVTLKTLNNKREMLSYLVKNKWNFTDVIKNENVTRNEIIAEKNIL